MRLHRWSRNLLETRKWDDEFKDALLEGMSRASHSQEWRNLRFFRRPYRGAYQAQEIADDSLGPVRASAGCHCDPPTVPCPRGYRQDAKRAVGLPCSRVVGYRVPERDTESRYTEVGGVLMPQPLDGRTVWRLVRPLTATRTLGYFTGGSLIRSLLAQLSRSQSSRTFASWIYRGSGICRGLHRIHHRPLGQVLAAQSEIRRA